MHDSSNVGIAIAAPGEDFWHLLQVGNRVQIGGRLFPPKATVQIAAYGGVLTAPGKLADVIDVIGNVRESDALIVSGTPRPARAQHPAIECNTDHALPGYDRVDLSIIKLALVRDESPAIRMAGEH